MNIKYLKLTKKRGILYWFQALFSQHLLFAINALILLCVYYI